MDSLRTLPAFDAYVLTTILLMLNLLILWIISGLVRRASGTIVNAEDVKSPMTPGARVVDADPPNVARVLRAHRNAFDNILPFLLTAGLWVAVGAPASLAGPLFAVFVAARIVHSICYLARLQPWRTIVFFISIAAQFVVLGFLLWHWLS